MRVGISTTALEQSINGGHVDGIGIYTSQLLTGLPQHDVSVKGYSYPPIHNLNADITVGERFNLPYQLSSMLSISSKGKIKTKVDVDVYHATDYRIVSMNVPVIATLYDAIPLKNPEMANGDQRKLKNIILKKSAHFADKVIAISNYSVNELVEFYKIPQDKISIIHCGIDSEWYKKLDDSLIVSVMEKRNLRKGFFLSVGTIQPRKNYERLISAYEKLPQHIRDERQLVIVGKPGWGVDALIERLNSLSDSGNIIWLQDVNDSYELQAIYQAAGVFVFLSLYEGFGLPIVEAFASGVPVITSNVTSLPEISSNCAVEINPFSVDDLVASMESLVSNEAERRLRIDAGLRRAQDFSVESTLKQTIELYRSVL